MEANQHDGASNIRENLINLVARSFKQRHAQAHREPPRDVAALAWEKSPLATHLRKPLWRRHLDYWIKPNDSYIALTRSMKRRERSERREHKQQSKLLKQEQRKEQKIRRLLDAPASTMPRPRRWAGPGLEDTSFVGSFLLNGMLAASIASMAALYQDPTAYFKLQAWSQSTVDPEPYKVAIVETPEEATSPYASRQDIIYDTSIPLSTRQYVKYLNNPYVLAALDSIAYAEGTYDAGDQGYFMRYGGGFTDDLSAHPRTKISKGKYTSSATGRYMFLWPTWKWVQPHLGLPDMGPASQEIAAIYLIDRAGMLPEILDGNIGVAILGKGKGKGALNRIWASLEGNPDGQALPHGSVKNIKRVHQKFLRVHLAR